MRLAKIFTGTILISSTLICSASFAGSWDQFTHGRTGSKPVYAGERKGFVMYVCRGVFADQTLPGKLVYGQNCSIPYAGGEVWADSYEVLQGSYKWVDSNEVSSNSKLLLAGTDKYGREQFICRTKEGVPGRLTNGLQSDLGGCQWGWGDDEHISWNYDVLLK